MPWLYRLMKFAQTFRLSINSIVELYQSLISPDISNQNYLFQGPEIAELIRLRSMDSNILDQVLSMMHNIFFVFENMQDEYNYDRDLNDYELDDEMMSIAEIYVEHLEFNDNEDYLMSIIQYLAGDHLTSMNQYLAGSPEDSHLNNVIKDVLFPASHILPTSEEFNVFFKELQDLEKNLSRLSDTQNSNMFFNAEFVRKRWNTAIQLEDEGRDGTEIWEDAVALFTSEYLYSISQLNQWWPHTGIIEHLPPYLPKRDFYRALKNDDRAIDWYIEDNKPELRRYAEEEIHERDAYAFTEHIKEWVHRFGFDIINVLSSPYDRSDVKDYRRDISLSQISEITQQIFKNAWLISGGQDAAEKSSTIIYAIRELLSQDEIMKHIFANDLNIMTFDPSAVINGIDRLAREDTQYVFGPVGDLINQKRRVIEENNATEEEQRRLAEERERQFQDEIFKKQRHLEEKRNEMLPNMQETSTPEQLDKLRELGIAKHPFNYTYELKRRTFPGAGVFNMPNMIPFVMSISPTQEYIDQKEIPTALMESTLLHDVPYHDVPALGWVGGYADYINKILYIGEVQSDLMQRTVHMRDPKKIINQREHEVADIQQRIRQVQYKIKNAVSPRQQLVEKLNRIRQENNGLSSDDIKLQRNQRIIDNLLRQLPNVPDVIDTTNLQNELKSLNKFLTDAQQRLQESREDEDVDRRYPVNSLTKKYRSWHDYKSKIENSFKEWIPIFFNAIFRLARDKGYIAIRIVSAADLMRRWDKYARPETRHLFERVYDQTARSYNANLIRFDGSVWWEVKMDQNERIANWLHRLIKQGTHEWFTRVPGGKQIWQIHLDTFFRKMREHAPELFNSHEFAVQTGDYVANEGKRAIFNEWLKEVPTALKFGDDLEPGFKRAVREYLLETEGFDPYEYESSDDIEIPSANELNEWFELDDH